MVVDATSTFWASPIQGRSRKVDEPAPGKSRYRSFVSGQSVPGSLAAVLSVQYSLGKLRSAVVLSTP
jgi:hypothetical protein